MKKKKRKDEAALVADNAKSRHDYHVHEQIEAGLQLEGWEVKSLRQRRIQLKEGYVYVQDEEIYVSSVTIDPLPTCSSAPNPRRTRKLLLHKKEILWLKGISERKGYTLIPLRVYWKNSHIKIAVGLCQGKKKHDKRATEKNREWKIERQRILKHSY